MNERPKWLEEGTFNRLGIQPQNNPPQPHMEIEDTQPPILTPPYPDTFVWDNITHQIVQGKEQLKELARDEGANLIRSK